MFKKLTKPDILTERKEDEVKMKYVKGGFIHPLPYPTPVEIAYGTVYINARVTR